MRPNLYLFPIILKLIRAESASGEVFLHCYCPARNLITVSSTIFTAMPSLGKKFRNIRIDLVTDKRKKSCVQAVSTVRRFKFDKFMALHPRSEYPA